MLPFDLGELFPALSQPFPAALPLWAMPTLQRLLAAFCPKKLPGAAGGYPQRPLHPLWPCCLPLLTSTRSAPLLGLLSAQVLR